MRRARHDSRARWRRVGIRDVAREARVSPATVSHALNGKGRVDARTRGRILEAARALGYRANPSAQSLRGARTGVLGLTNRKPEGLAVSLTELEYFYQVLSAATSTAFAHGYCLILTPPVVDATALDDLPIDGTILIDPLHDDGLLRRLEQIGVATVTVGRDPSWEATTGWWVDNDIRSCVTSMLNHLDEAGSKRIALITGPPVQSFIVDTRESYLAWLGARSQSPLIAEIDGSSPGDPAYEATLRLLDQPDPPDAIYADLESSALRALAAARARGLRVPGDVRIAAGSDSEAARKADPPVTTLDLHPSELGQRAVQMLVRRIEDQSNEPHHELVDGEIVIRASTW